MAQLATPGGPRQADVLTVADLLRRNAPVPVRILAATDVPPVSVVSLLRREGRAPHAVGRPLRPRASRIGAHESRVAGAASAIARRGAVGAGALLAAGSVFGVTAVTDASLRGQWPAADPRPAQGVPNLAPTLSAVAAPGVVLDRSGTAAALDAGVEAPSAWLPIAFPAAAPTAAPRTTPVPAAVADSEANDGSDDDPASDSERPTGEGDRPTGEGDRPTGEGDRPTSARPEAARPAGAGLVAARPVSDSARPTVLSPLLPDTGDAVTDPALTPRSTSTRPGAPDGDSEPTAGTTPEDAPTPTETGTPTPAPGEPTGVSTPAPTTADEDTAPTDTTDPDVLPTAQDEAAAPGPID